MNDNVLIRKAEVKDIEAINALFYELDTDAINMQPQHFKRGTRPAEYLAGLITGENSEFLLAAVGENVIGFSLLFEKKTPDIDLLVPCKFGYIQDFVVSKDYRGMGVGSLLMEMSKKWAKDRGLAYIRLSVLPENKDAQRFYARHGLNMQMFSMEGVL